MSDKLVEALRTIIKQEVISEFDARELSNKDVIDDDHATFTTSQVESIKEHKILSSQILILKKLK